jgi:FAD:protein FMN transferase
VSDLFVLSEGLMGTIVTIQVVGHGANADQESARRDGVARAFNWFRDINDRCSRFDPSSELSRLSAQVNTPVTVSEILFEAISFAIAVADATDGVFDPTVGGRMEQLGFNREFRTGATVESATERHVTYRDVTLDHAKHTVVLAAPMMLDLGAVAKGLAIDVAARELTAFRHFAIDAGGDLFLSGLNAQHEPWAVGIRHPRHEREILGMLRVSDAAVCTSGDYERMTIAGDHHIVDARTGSPSVQAASVTVQAGSAMVADALATAAFALGPTAGIALLESQGVEGLIVTPELQRFATAGMHV